MTRIKKFMMLSVLALATTMAVQSVSFCAENVAPNAKKYAVVDVKKVVSSSQSVKALKEERKQQKETILNFVKNGNAQVAAEKDAAKKEALKKKLNNELKYMTNTYDKKYKEGLANVNKEISTEIAKVGKAKKYDLILTTDSVLYGGENITNEIVKSVK